MKFSKAVRRPGTNLFELPLTPATPGTMPNHMAAVDDADLWAASIRIQDNAMAPNIKFDSKIANCGILSAVHHFI